MKISYAITVCNELEEVTKLLNFLVKHRRIEDEIVVLFDKGKGTAEVWSRLLELNDEPNIRLEKDTFKHHFADWKNQLTSYCSGDYIFQIDADEIPHEKLIEMLPNILEKNNHNDVFLVPRVNTVEGILDEHIRKWRWQLNDKKWINWPDNQWRIYKNNDKVKWVNKVHERLDGFQTFASLPPIEEYALYHPKTIDRQEKQNSYYDTL
tara:strand:- start:950 stop:1573 length:624 start_codon:yes stop_codon:yes gene_type:complete